MNPFSLAGQRALVTGGSRGIGLGIARGLASAGADLVLLARDARALESARASLSGSGRRVDVEPFDMAALEAIPDMYRRLVERRGPIDILVHGAGGIRRGPTVDVSLEDWRRVVDLNLTSVFVLSRCFAAERIESRREGKIILIASLLSEGARKGTASYAASKGAVRQLTKALAVDWAPHGIRVNAIGPGYIRTDLTASLQQDPDFDGWVVRRTPLGRWGTPEDLAPAAVFLASPASDFVTGQILYVDGGWLATF